MTVNLTAKVFLIALVLLSGWRGAHGRIIGLAYETGAVPHAGDIRNVPSELTGVLPCILILPWELVHPALDALESGAAGDDPRGEAKRLAVLLHEQYPEFADRVPDTMMVIWGYPGDRRTRLIGVLGYQLSQSGEGSASSLLSELEDSRAQQLQAWRGRLERFEVVAAGLQTPRPGPPYFAKFKGTGPQIEMGPFLSKEMVVSPCPHGTTFNRQLGVWEFRTYEKDMGSYSNIRYSPLYGAVSIVSLTDPETAKKLKELGSRPGVPFLRLICAFDSAGPVPVEALAEPIVGEAAGHPLLLWGLVAIGIVFLSTSAVVVTVLTRRRKLRMR